MLETIINKTAVNIEDEMKRSYMDYAMSVIIGRALPDVRDGLKPVHRRCLFAMYEMSNDWNKPYKKSARVVGDVIGKYHPHGDSAAYDTIVRMAQDFSLRYPLVDGQGNFGSVDGDAPAAMRYTEIRMEQLAHELLDDLDKETVEMGPNYDGSLFEPLVLPAKFPNLLVNGSSGIAVGMATNIPPHNLSEVIDGIIAVIDNPQLTFAELFALIPGPDFPTGGFIYGREGILQGYRTGRGIVQMRARAIVETQKKSERQSIIVTEIPYQVNKANLITKIAELVREKKLEGISDLRDESDRDGMRIVIELKRDEEPQIILNHLYKQTQMQCSFGINMLAIVAGRPKVLTLRDAIGHFIDHRREIVTRRTIFELKKAEARAHILEGLKIALDWLDAVIELIRAARNPEEAKQGLMAGNFSDPQFIKKLGLPEEKRGFAPSVQLSDKQAQAILEMRLQRLTGLERDKILAGIHRYHEPDHPSQGDPRLRGGDPQHHRYRTARAEGEVRRRAAHRDRRSDRGNHPRGHHCRGRHGGDHLPHRLHQAHRGLALPLPAPRRQGEDRHEDQGGGFRRTPVRCLQQGQHAVLHRYRPGLPEEGLRNPRGGRATRGKAIVNLLNLAEGEKIAAILSIKGASTKSATY